MELDRRTFVKASAAAAAMTAASGTIIANAAENNETIDCDIVVVGSGMSGLTAAVEALNGGASVVVLESQEIIGGNANLTSCCCAVGSDMQKELGIDLIPGEMINVELEVQNYAPDGTRWADLLHNSADNITWLQEQGVQFSGVVDYYVDGLGKYKTAHWWAGNEWECGYDGFVSHMVERINELGGTILTNTPGKELIVDEDGVHGIYADGPDGRIQLNCKAAILCCGGFNNDPELLASKGYDWETFQPYDLPGHDGDGIKMAIAAGGKSWMDHAILMDYPTNPLVARGASNQFCRSQFGIWVNGNAERFTNENCHGIVPGRATLAMRTQKTVFTLCDTPVAEETQGVNHDAGMADLESWCEAGYMYKCDTIEACAEAVGLDPQALAATVEKWNASVENGADAEFGKETEVLRKIEVAPFYITYSRGIDSLCSIGGIDTTRYCEVRKAEGEGVVKGLFAAGVDGCELYADVYTISVPGSCDANNVNSGRTAAKMALQLL